MEIVAQLPDADRLPDGDADPDRSGDTHFPMSMAMPITVHMMCCRHAFTLNIYHKIYLIFFRLIILMKYSFIGRIIDRLKFTKIGDYELIIPTYL